jgi:hypothetical protein
VADSTVAEPAEASAIPDAPARERTVEKQPNALLCIKVIPEPRSVRNQTRILPKLFP